MSTCSAMVAITGSGLLGSNSLEAAASMPARFLAEPDHHALQAEAQAERRDPVLTGVAQGTELPLHASDAEASRHADGVDVGQLTLGSLPGCRSRRSAPTSG